VCATNQSHLVLNLLHRCAVALANGALVVAENGHLTVAVIVKSHLFSNRPVVVFELLQLGRHGVRSVVGTKHLGSQAGHVAGQMFVELRCLE